MNTQTDIKVTSPFKNNFPKMLNILLIEDNQADIDLTKNALEEIKIPLKLEVRTDGTDGIEYLHETLRSSTEQLPDLILLDLNMPKKNGRQVLRELKANTFLKKIPVVILTTSEDEIDIGEAFNLGAEYYLVKPTNLEANTEILNIIEQVWISKVPNTETKSYPQNQKVIRIVLIEDSPADADLVKEYVKDQPGGFEVEHFFTLAEAFSYIKNSSNVDVIISDLNLPDSFGQDTITKLSSTFPNIPLVILTGNEDQNIALNSLNTNVQEFIVKGDISPSFFPRMIRYALKRKEYDLQKSQALAKDLALLAEAENSLQLRDEFMSIASHELKTPITSLKLQIEVVSTLLEKLKKNEISLDQITGLLAKADIQVDRMTNLVNTLLDISRINSGKFHLNKKLVSINEILDNTLEALKEDFKKSNVEIKLNIHNQFLGNWDSNRLEQVFINLLTNAKKYAPQSPIEINVFQHDNKVTIEVKDFGPGIKKEDQARIFNRFERVTETTKVSGLGLGLYISKQIVDAHAGRIWLESDIDQGCKFTVELPQSQL